MTPADLKTARKRFRTPRLQERYEMCLRLAQDRSSDFYHDGQPSRGAGYKNAFWNGAEGLPNRTFAPGTFGYAAYRAGQDFAKCNARN